MNVAFTVIFLSSATVLLFLAPENFLSSLLSGASGAASLCVALLASYSVWLGLMRLWEESGVTKSISKLLKPAVKKVFALEKDDAAEAVCMNLSANLLGIGSAATPYGIEASKKIDGEKNANYAASMLFAVNASSLQLIPTTIVAMRVSAGSANPADVILPALIATVCSTLLSVLLVAVFVKKSPKERVFRFSTPTNVERTTGAGVRS